MTLDPKEAGIPTEPGSKIWMVSMIEIIYEPPVIIFYEYDNLNVWLLSVRVSDLDLMDSGEMDNNE